MILSICLTVYNQIELVKYNISQIVQYKGNDIEIVISDDCSTENIEDMVKSFKDDRIKYYRTNTNKSHDGNILNALRVCKGKYIYLFRSKDIIIPEKINSIIDIIKKHEDSSYFLFSALDENSNIRMKLSDKKYEMGHEAQGAHGFLLVHPSGQIYRKDNLRVDLYEKYIDKYFPTFNGCDVHQLIRMDLALQGDFVTSSEYTWKYAYTLNAKNNSVIKTEKKMNIYAPYYQYQRYECEFNFVLNEIPESYQHEYFRQIIRQYMWYTVVFFMQINNNDDYNRHYGSEPIDYNPYSELAFFCKKSKLMITRLSYKNKKKLCFYMMKHSFKIALFDIPKEKLRSIIHSNEYLIKLWRIIKTV